MSGPETPAGTDDETAARTEPPVSSSTGAETDDASPVDGPKGSADASADAAVGADDDPDPDGASDPDGAADTESADAEVPELDEGEVLFEEPGGSWWVVAIGPVLIALTLGLEIYGGGRIHWEVLAIFGVVLLGFSILQVIAARRHVSVRLTERRLRQGTAVVDLADIVKIYPENRTDEYQDWESAPALGELHAVPRRRKGIGVRLVDGKLAQAWARDVERLRTELVEAHLAVRMGLPPKGSGSGD